MEYSINDFLCWRYKLPDNKYDELPLCEKRAVIFGVVDEAAFHPLINEIRPSLNQSQYLAAEELYLCSDAPLR